MIYEQFKYNFAIFLKWKICYGMVDELMVPPWRTRAEGSSSRCGIS